MRIYEELPFENNDNYRDKQLNACRCITEMYDLCVLVLL